jgi:hypothetical protein
MTFQLPDAVEIDALRTDRYLESLLAGTDRGAAAETDPAIVSAAVRLGGDLVRVHPSFRFEERLARRLADVAASLRLPAAAGAEGESLVVPPMLPFPYRDVTDPGADAFDPEGGLGAPTVPRPVLIGGAVASALSLAGAAIVAWRLGRGGAIDPMTRAVRAAHEARSGRTASADLDA